MQGGIFDALAADRFLSRRFAWDAIRLRRWDDGAKNAGQAIPCLREFEPLLRSVERRNPEKSLLPA
jgi:predicted HD phosphohydrolase